MTIPAAVSTRRTNACWPLLDAGETKAIDDELERIDELRDDLNKKLDSIRADMLVLLREDANQTVRKQQQVMLISVFLTMLAAVLGLVFALLVSAGVTRPVRRLLEGTRAVEAGNLDRNAGRHLTGRDRPPDHRVQPDGRAVASQGAPARNLRQICRPARRRRADRGAGAGGRRPAPRHDRAVLRRQRFYQHQRRHDAAGAGQGDEPLFLDHVGADPRPSGHHRQIYRRRHHGLLGTAVHRPRRAGAACQPGGAGDVAAACRSCGPSFPSCSAFARCRTPSTSASASPPARCWSAASAPS